MYLLVGYLMSYLYIYNIYCIYICFLMMHVLYSHTASDWLFHAKWIRWWWNAHGAWGEFSWLIPWLSDKVKHAGKNHLPLHPEKTMSWGPNTRWAGGSNKDMLRGILDSRSVKNRSPPTPAQIPPRESLLADSVPYQYLFHHWFSWWVEVLKYNVLKDIGFHGHFRLNRHFSVFRQICILRTYWNQQLVNTKTRGKNQNIVSSCFIPMFVVLSAHDPGSNSRIYRSQKNHQVVGLLLRLQPFLRVLIFVPLPTKRTQKKCIEMWHIVTAFCFWLFRHVRRAGPSWSKWIDMQIYLIHVFIYIYMFFKLYRYRYTAYHAAHPAPCPAPGSTRWWLQADKWGMWKTKSQACG